MMDGNAIKGEACSTHELRRSTSMLPVVASIVQVPHIMILSLTLNGLLGNHITCTKQESGSSGLCEHGSSDESGTGIVEQAKLCKVDFNH